MKKFLSNRTALLLFVTPALLIFTFLTVIPVLSSLRYMFFDGMPGVNFAYVGMKNIQEAIHDPKLWKYVGNNLKMILVVGVGEVGLGFLYALLVRYGVRRFKNFVRVAIFLPFVLPTVAVGMLFKKIFAVAPQYGLLNALLDMVGAKGLIRGWTGESATALYTVCAVIIWKGAGFYCLIFYSAMMEISGDLHEAAMIDGASLGQEITRIQIPMLKPVFRTAFILTLTGNFKAYDSVVALTGGGPGDASYVPALYMYNTAFSYMRYGYGSVIAIFILLECLLATALVSWLMRKDNLV